MTHKINFQFYDLIEEWQMELIKDRWIFDEFSERRRIAILSGTINDLILSKIWLGIIGRDRAIIKD